MMYKNRNVLLIGGGGTLGTYTANELLQLGCYVDVLCPEDKESNDERLIFHKGFATEDILRELVTAKHYHGIINFIHYRDVGEYKPIHELLSVNTDHLIFLSSYRVYADLQHPITETAPRLLDVSDDKEFLETEKYAVSKAKGEDFLLNESKTDNWTIVRPVISFSDKRLDLVVCSGQKIIERAKSGNIIYMPKGAKDVVAGLDWAGNSGKIIANLLFKKEAYKEAYTISSAQNITWGQVAEYYTEFLGIKFEWLDDETFWLSGEEDMSKIYTLKYDRYWNRTIDNSKVLATTRLTKKDFVSIKNGIQIELKKLL